MCWRSYLAGPVITVDEQRSGHADAHLYLVIQQGPEIRVLIRRNDSAIHPTDAGLDVLPVMPQENLAGVNDRHRAQSNFASRPPRCRSARTARLNASETAIRTPTISNSSRPLPWSRSTWNINSIH